MHDMRASVGQTRGVQSLESPSHIDLINFLTTCSNLYSNPLAINQSLSRLFRANSVLSCSKIGILGFAQWINHASTPAHANRIIECVLCLKLLSISAV
jgi:hypothetical protein